MPAFDSFTISIITVSSRMVPKEPTEMKQVKVKQAVVDYIKEYFSKNADRFVKYFVESTIKYVNCEVIAKLASFKQECDSMLSEFVW